MTHRQFILALLVAAPAASADGLLIGRNSANRLIPVLEFTNPLAVPRSIFPGFPGYASAYPGFGSLTVSTPALNQFVLLPTANIELFVLAIDAGLLIRNDTPSGFLSVGQTYYLGHPFFDYHPIWNIPAADYPPAPPQMFSVTFVIRDRAGIYADSAPFTVTLTPAPCPGDFTNDGTVNTADLVFLLARFGLHVAPGAPGSECDLNNDGLVNTPDLTSFLSKFSTACP